MSKKINSLPPEPVYVLRCDNMKSVNSICFYGNDILLAGTTNSDVHVWDLQTNRSKLQLQIGTDPITTLHHTENMLITQEKGGNIKFWNITNTGYKLYKKIQANYMAFCHSELIEKNILFYPDKESTIVAIDIKNDETNKIVFNPDNPKLGNITCLKSIIIKNETYIIAGYENGDIFTWDIRSAKVINTLKIVEYPVAIDYDSINNRGIIGSPENKLISFEYNDENIPQLIPMSNISITNPGINCIKIRPDKKILSTGGWDSRIRIFSWKTLRPLAVLTEHKSGGIMDIAYSSGNVFRWNKQIMAAAGMDGKISLWDIYT